MTVFTSRSAESYDQFPYRVTRGGVHRREALPSMSQDTRIYDPRPEFEPTRDEFPWQDALGNVSPVPTGVNTHWAPRDRNRNRILIAFRGYVRDNAHQPHWTIATRAAEYAQDFLNRPRWLEAHPAEIEHARKVLNRLANFNKED